jgi:hypothetical protein
MDGLKDESAKEHLFVLETEFTHHSMELKCLNANTNGMYPNWKHKRLTEMKNMKR